MNLQTEARPLPCSARNSLRGSRQFRPRTRALCIPATTLHKTLRAWRDYSFAFAPKDYRMISKKMLASLFSHINKTLGHPEVLTV